MYFTVCVCAKAGVLEGKKKALFLLYIEANSVSLGADSTQYLMPESTSAPVSANLLLHYLAPSLVIKCK